MKNKPLVSIITPTYNHEKYIAQCIESVLAQTYDNWEQIIIDDGSNDRTSEIIKKYKDPRVHYIRQENLGIWQLVKTYNKALDLSEGDFIAILEGDDYWPKNKLEKQLPSFDNSNIIISWGKGLMVDSNNKLIREIFPKDFNRYEKIYQNTPPGIALRKLLLTNFLIPTATVIVRRKALIEIGGFKQPSGVPYVDFPTWLEICLKGEFCFVNETLGYWRRHSSQITSAHSAEEIFGHVKVSTNFYQKLSSEQKITYGIKDNLITGNNHWLCGSAYLIKKKWKKARREFFKAIIKGSLPIKLKLKSFGGLIFSFFHISSLIKKLFF